MPEYDITDIVSHSIEGNAVKLRDAVNDVMAGKVYEYLSDMKKEVAANIFSGKSNNAN